ncbi:hypothetical protein M9458_056277, partial [Cirrhinus mrigala]
LVSTPGNTEELRAEIESITVSLLRKKQDLYRQHDSNQTRQRKKKKIRDLKKKLREKILQYNSAEEDKIDEELACSLTEDYILPWERLGDDFGDMSEDAAEGWKSVLLHWRGYVKKL